MMYMLSRVCLWYSSTILSLCYGSVDLVFKSKPIQAGHLILTWIISSFLCVIKLIHSRNINPLCEKSIEHTFLLPVHKFMCLLLYRSVIHLHYYFNFNSKKLCMQVQSSIHITILCSVMEDDYDDVLFHLCVTGLLNC